MSENELLWLLVNNASGSNDPKAIANLEQALAHAGHPAAVTVALPDDDLPDRAALERAGVDTLAIFAGDGTANAAISGLYGWEGKVLVLPGGTQNLLAKSLHGDATPEVIVADLAAGRLTRVDRLLLRCSQGDALCEIVAGPGAHWSDVRETMRDGDIAEIASSLGEAISQSAAGPMVVVGDPPLGRPEGYAAVRAHLNDGRLVADGYGAQGLADYAKQGVALIRRDFREGPHDELGVQDEVICISEAPIELMIDGERRTGGTRETITTHPCEVAFLSSSTAQAGA
ncbi:diacylglycerol/lipid kinase family protein [Novosphingobium tardum]|uniref:Diacylglycerol/lipid kinase family protein n=1 Tax=Novosphingobium tardum TaxID=1538021 RepID=A0ABV8RNS0_9SPHN